MATKTTQQKITVLSKDFLDRDSGTLVKSRKTGRLNWESTIGAGGAYSEFILHPKSTEYLIKNAFGLASDMLKVMDTPFKVNVRITPDSSCTDSDTVWVATKVFDDPNMTVGKKLDTFIGLAVHEGCHLLYTDFRSPSGNANSTILALQNIIEDERIERICGDSRPGLSNFLAASKYYYFDKYRHEMESQGCLESLDTPKRLMNAILSYIRYPKALDLNDVKEFCDVLLTVREVLTPYPNSTADSLEAAQKIFDAMKDYLLEEKRQHSTSSAGQGNSDGQSEPMDEVAQPSGQSPDNSSTQAEQGTGIDLQHSDDIDYSLSQMGDALSALAKDLNNKSLADDDISDTVQKEGGKVGQICEGRLERGIYANTYIARAGESKDIYDQSLGRVKQYIPAVSKALRCFSTEYKLSLRGMRSGTLDTNKLAEAVQGVQSVYLRNVEVKAEKVVVCILLDESGSMWGCGEEAARDTAVLLNEALGNIPNVDLYIYGHTATKSTTSLFVYREKGFRKRYTLGTTDSRASNHDSIAIREAAARIRRFTKEQCLFFVISDGAPNESTTLVRKTVQDISRDGFSLVAVSIDPYYDPATMYDNNVAFTDLPSLSISLGKMVKTTLQKKLKKTCV